MSVKPTDNHVQCKLRHGARITYSWIPQKYAQVGRVLKLKDDNGEWENGWEVVETWGVRPSAEVLDRERDYLTQRQASDI